VGRGCAHALQWPAYCGCETRMHVLQELGVRRAIICGGGSLAPHLDDFFEALGLPVLNGWGLTGTTLPLFRAPVPLRARVPLGGASHTCTCQLLTQRTCMCIACARSTRFCSTQCVLCVRCTECCLLCACNRWCGTCAAGRTPQTHGRHACRGVARARMPRPGDGGMP
jgi:hypothetical protein